MPPRRPPKNLPPPRGLRGDWPAVALLYVGAFTARILFLHAPPYGDESLHYYVAKHFWHSPSNLDTPYGPWLSHPGIVFFQRPLAYLLFAPAAQISFEAFRAWHLTLTSLLPVFAFLLLRRHRVRLPIALGAALVLALHPLLVVWGVLGLMDSLMATAFLAALYGLDRGRSVASALLMLAAVWIKESAIIGWALVIVCSLVRGARQGPTRLWPLRLNHQQSAHCIAFTAALAPLIFAMSKGLPFPGGSTSQPDAYLLESFYLTAWFLPLVLAGLAWTRTRFWSALGLVYPATYLGLQFALHRSVEVWYLVQPATVTVVAAAFTLDEALHRLPRHASAVTRWAARAAATAPALLILFLLLAPNTDSKAEALHPLSKKHEDSFPQVIRYENEIRDRDYRDAVARLAQANPADVFAVDVQYQHLLHPIVDQSPHVYYLPTGVSMWDFFDLHTAPVAHVAEEQAQVTFINKRTDPLNRALQDTYRDCAFYENPGFLLVHGAGCAGRADRLHRLYLEYRDGDGAGG